MSHFDALMYAAGLLAFWLGLIVLAVSLFVVSSRADDVAEEWGGFEPCTCTLACEPRGITAEQRCRMEDSCS